MVRLLTKTLAAVLILGCAPDAGRQDPAGQREGSGQDGLFSVSRDDPEMAEATRKAQSTLNEFLETFRSPKPGYHEFSVKKPFLTQDGSYEHIWLSLLKYEGKQLTCLVDNDPVDVNGLGVGKQVIVDLADISDWQYFDGKRIVGSFTTRVIMSRLPPEELKAFEEMGY